MTVVRERESGAMSGGSGKECDVLRVMLDLRNARAMAAVRKVMTVKRRE